ncbi:hypothetical protein CLD22_26835, partial [Rubrivivax gelatinosus]|nr:hypothetical protein [Rubrivivax gelatinosus]
SDAALNSDYETDPQAVILRFGLSAEEGAALLDKDYEAIKRLTGLQDGQFSTQHSIQAYD